jgi:hypothetical protein
LNKGSPTFWTIRHCFRIAAFRPRVSPGLALIEAARLSFFFGIKAFKKEKHKGASLLKNMLLYM